MENGNIKCNALNVQKFFLKKLTWKPIDDEEVLGGLLLFTDYNNKYQRLNLEYVFLLNLENKFK